MQNIIVQHAFEVSSLLFSEAHPASKWMESHPREQALLADLPVYWLASIC